MDDSMLTAFLELESYRLKTGANNIKGKYRNTIFELANIVDELHKRRCG